MGEKAQEKQKGWLLGHQKEEPTTITSGCPAMRKTTEHWQEKVTRRKWSSSV